MKPQPPPAPYALRHVLLSLGAVGVGFSLQAGVPPDPADTFLQLVPTTLGVGAPSQSTDLVALSGDGRTAVQSTRYVSDFFGHVSVIEDEFLIQDGQRTLLHHYQADQASFNSPFIANGPSWATVGLSRDGSRLLTNRRGSAKGSALVQHVPDLVETPLPLATGLLLSQDGDWAVGPDEDHRLRRCRVSDGHLDPIEDPARAYGLTPYAVSDHGDVVFGEAFLFASDPPVYRYFRWSSEQGFQLLDLPVGFFPHFMDGTGRVLVGLHWRSDDLSVPQTGALWTPEGGLVKLTLTVGNLTGQYGNAWLISGDGQRIVGSISGPAPSVDVLWTRDGQAHRLDGLFPGLDFNGTRLQTPRAINWDGSVIAGMAGTARNEERTYLAGLAFPGEGPKVALLTVAPGQRSLQFRAKTGFRYQAEQATDLGAWTPLGSPVLGADTLTSIPLPADADARGFYRLVVSAR